MHWKKTLLISATILFISVIITTLIFSTEPEATSEGATKKTAMLVDVIEVQKGEFQPLIVAMGTVEPAQDIILSPRVGGEIIKRSTSFIPGGIVRKGEIMLQIDPADFQNTLKRHQSDLRQATADLNIEMGRQNVARKDYQLLDEVLSAENEALVLRKPQLNAARAEVEAARAVVKQAKLELERTNIRAPFDAHVLSRNVNVGSQVAPGDNLGHIVGLDTYWVVVTIPQSKLRWISFSYSAGQKGAEVRIQNRTAWPAGDFRTGYVYKWIGALQDGTRMARILVTVDDPLAHKSASTQLPRLMIDAFVEARIKGKKLNDVIRVNRDYIRKNNTVWVMKNHKLRIKDLSIIVRDQEYAYIQEGLVDGDSIVTTNLTTVVDGARLRLSGRQPRPDQEDSSAYGRPLPGDTVNTGAKSR
ncbi:MAG: efflux RND transporter periplasmic adaptor subunit [Caldithrix sp.]|nr:efflux RND transporter periplasmic adaptor subunit [Caldithrix sp.]